MAKLKFDARKTLYTSDQSAWSIEQTHAALDAVYRTGKPIVVFVHGRGKEPNKSLRGGSFVEGLAVHKIERGYDVSVLMFNWDSAFPGVSIYDRTNALRGAMDAQSVFAQFLADLGGYFAAHPMYRKPTLLVHSMGSIVIQHVVEKQGWPAQKLFSSVLLSQPDADDVEHAKWIEKLATVEDVYITINRDDHVLQRSRDDRPAGAQALGLGTDQPLASNAKYIDLTNMGPLGKKDDDHEVFGKGAMNGQIHVCEFFTQAICGRPITLGQNKNVESVSGQVVFKLKSEYSPTDPRLKKPDLSDFTPQPFDSDDFFTSN